MCESIFHPGTSKWGDQSIFRNLQFGWVATVGKTISMGVSLREQARKFRECGAELVRLTSER
jgi:hypothetical protein